MAKSEVALTPQTVDITRRRWMRHWWAPRSSNLGRCSNINGL